MANIFTNTDLFRIINEYTDLRSLCDTCSFGKNQEFLSKVAKGKQSFPLGSLFATLKKYIYYKLNREYSLMYYDDILFRNRVLNKIFNPNKQLHLDVSDSRITDVSVLGNVHSLSLRCCYKITDVSALGCVHTLNLHGCRYITDVSALNNVYDLNLSGCNNITDVSALGNVHTLYLGRCNEYYRCKCIRKCS
jgi:hypothetical protein